MSKNKNFVWHTVAFNVEDETNFRNSHMKLIDIFRFAMKRNPEPLFKTTASSTLYLSNATNEPIGNNEPAEPLSARPDPAELTEPTEPDHPAAMVRPDLMTPATVHGPGAAVADHAEIRTDPVPPPTVLIVRKGTRPHIHIVQPQQPARPDPVSMAILHKNVTTAFVQIER